MYLESIKSFIKFIVSWFVFSHFAIKIQKPTEKCWQSWHMQIQEFHLHKGFVIQIFQKHHRISAKGLLAWDESALYSRLNSLTHQTVSNFWLKGRQQFSDATEDCKEAVLPPWLSRIFFLPLKILLLLMREWELAKSGKHVLPRTS